MLSYFVTGGGIVYSGLFNNSLSTSFNPHLSNKHGDWNKRGGGAKVAKSINVEVGINVEGVQKLQNH